MIRGIEVDRSRPLSDRADIGHVHLKVADLDRSLAFYCDVLGFRSRQRWGQAAAFVAAGYCHHHIGLNTWESLGVPPPPPSTTGLFHLAIRYPDRCQLADALRRVMATCIELDGAADHGVSEALYLSDPDRNGVELYRDRPAAQWPVDGNGHLAMGTERLDLEALLAEPPACLSRCPAASPSPAITLPTP